jgi:hypothetical protein
MSRASIALLRRLTLIAAVGAAPAFGEQTDSHNQAAQDDSLAIKLIHAQIDALQDYERCLQGDGIRTPCRPPRPLQVTLLQQPSEDDATHSESMLDSAARMLRDAELRVIKAHSKCIKTQQAEMCGPAP